MKCCRLKFDVDDAALSLSRFTREFPLLPGANDVVIRGSLSGVSQGHLNIDGIIIIIIQTGGGTRSADYCLPL
jgi:hypothetical protein